MANYNFDKSKQCIGSVTVEIDFHQKKSTDSTAYDSDKMAAEFIQQFNNQGFSVSQQVCMHTRKHTHTHTRACTHTRTRARTHARTHTHAHTHARTQTLCTSCCLFPNSFPPFLPPQLVFSFCDKLFGLVIKDIEAMDASILKGEVPSGKKQKVPPIPPSLSKPTVPSSLASAPEPGRGSDLLSTRTGPRLDVH